MFAPQTNPASPAVLLDHKQMFMCFTSSRGNYPFSLSRSANFSAPLHRVVQALVLGFLSPLSWRVSDRYLYFTRLAICAVSNRLIAAQFPPCPRTAGFLGGSR